MFLANFFDFREGKVVFVSLLRGVRMVVAVID